MRNQIFLFGLIIIVIASCKVYQAQPYDFPRPVDTTTKPIEYQKKKVYDLSKHDIYASNLFDGARLNDFKHIKGELFQATISPENKPINKSPYYAFQIWSKSSKTIELELNYTYAKHRYEPKISRDGINWRILDKSKFRFSKDSTNAFLTLDISADTLWVAGQEVQNSTHVKNWCKAKATNKDAQLSSIGKSKLGKDLWVVDIHNGEIEKKDIIVIMSRQHPPEVTGYFAMQAFVDAILEETKLPTDFRKKYRILVFPLMNPDGVDLGHWRHNAGGIDPNRDWAYYNQPENRQIADYIVKTATENKSNVILGLDFHSTYYDVYYTNKGIPKHLPNFKDYWLEGIHNAIGEDINERDSNVGSPVSKGWFHTQFGAVGITYEIGDGTPRDYIKVKGKTSAVEMMELLILR